MLIFKVATIAIVVTVLSLVIRQSRPDISVLVTVAGAIVILLLLLKQFSSIFSWFDELANKTNISSSILAVILKIVGIGYIAEFVATACEDAGNKSMAEKVVLSAKIIILSLSLPILSSVIDTIVSVL